MMKTQKTKDGFTLVELLVATSIIVIIFLGVIMSIIRCMDLNEYNKNASQAIVIAQSRMEQIKNTSFTAIAGSWHQTVFTSAELGALDTIASGVSYVDDSVSDIYEITVSVCWRQKNGRIIGEDLDLDGVLDSGEDVNGNGMIDSPVQFITLVYNK